MAYKEVVPLKREETDEYFSCTKQTKSRKRDKNRAKTLIRLEDLEKPLLEAARYQKHIHAQSDSTSDHFASKKSEDSGDYVHTNYDSKGVCSSNVPQLLYDENHNSEVPVEHLNYDLSSLQDNPETVQMSATHIHDIHQCKIPNQFVNCPTCASQLHSVAMPLFPHGNPMAGVFPSTGISPANMGISMQTQQCLVTIDCSIQMSIMHCTAQQSNVTPVMAGLMNSPEQLPTQSNDLLLQSNNALLNPYVPPVLNPSPLSINQIVASRNVSLQFETTSFNREGSALLMPNLDMNMNSAGNDHMAHFNNQSTQTQQPASGNVQNMMQHVAPDVCSQPFGSRPASVGTSSGIVIGKGRGRLI